MRLISSKNGPGRHFGGTFLLIEGSRQPRRGGPSWVHEALIVVTELKTTPAAPRSYLRVLCCDEERPRLPGCAADKPRCANRLYSVLARVRVRIRGARARMMVAGCFFVVPDSH